MRALVVTPDAELAVATRPDPEPGPGEVLVRVHGAGLNRADLAQRSGNYAAPPGSPPDIPGLEFAGEVVGHGPGVTAPAVGARGLRNRRGWRPGRAPRRARGAVRAASPTRLDLVTAGGVPEVFVTAHDAMVTQAALQPRRDPARPRGRVPASAPPPCNSARRWTARWWEPPAPPAKLERCRDLGLDHAVLAAREFDPDALAADITAAVGPGRRDPRAGRWRLRRDRPRGRRPPRSHRAHRPDGRCARRRRPRRDDVQAAPGVRHDAARPVGRREGRGDRRVHPRRRPAARVGRGVARDRPHPAARRRTRRPTTCWRPTRCSARSCSISPESSYGSTDQHRHPPRVLGPVDPERAHRVEPDHPDHRVLRVGKLAHDLQVVVLAVLER